MSFSIAPQGLRLLQVLLASTVVLTLFFSFTSFGTDVLNEHGLIPSKVQSSESPVPAKTTSAPPKETSAGRVPNSQPPEKKAANGTLDFQEIIYLSMPYRTDRQDAMSLIAAVSGLKLTMIPGVKVEDMHPKGMPGHIGPNDMSGTPALGIWRAHANVWRYIIDNDIQSALILEDDVDWDENIKDVMGGVDWQLRYNNTIRWGKDVQKGWNEECPYGCDWDELFIGQCGGSVNKKRLDLHSVYTDPNAPNMTDTPSWVKREMTEVWNLTDPDGVYVLSPTYEPLCLMGYALTKMGAMRLLYHIGGWKAIGYPVDNEIAWRTGEGKLSGYTLTPPVITSWRMGGSQDSDNDAGMMAKPVSGEGPSHGKSHGLKNSVRKGLTKFFEKDHWADLEKSNPLVKEEKEEEKEPDITA